MIDYNQIKQETEGVRDAKFFIEHKETRKWLYIRWEQKYISTSNGSRLKGPSIPHMDWTNDPHKAMINDSRERAQFWIKLYDLGDTVFLTEHEFID